VPDGSDLSSSLDSVRRRIAAAAHRVNRSPDDISLVAISKTVPAARIREAARLGQTRFGENRVQEAERKVADLAELPIEWHLVGHLQSNKARKAVALFSWIQSIDSIDLVKKVDAAADGLGVRRTILLQADLAHEATKHGADRRTLLEMARAALDSKALDLAGLMIVPPIPDTPEQSRPWFRQLRELRDELVAAGIPALNMRELSMGMSDDFEVAIEERATIVRVGSSIFGRRIPAAGPPPE
jgi:pyridoxal phosphate enzyme (YggS family)